MENTYSSVSNDVTSEIGIEIPRQISDALDDGKIIMNAVYGKSGVSTWVQFVGQDLHITYDLDTAVLILNKMKGDGAKMNERTPPTSPEMKEYKYKTGKTRTVHVPTHEPSASGSHPGGNRMHIERAKNLVSQAKLDRHRVNGVLNFYPADSLAPQDFKRTSDDHFLARVTVVAHKIGTSNAAARVLSQGGANGATDLNEWWALASVKDRARLLTRAKKCDIDRVDVSRLSEVANPFGCADLQTADNEESADELLNA